MKKIKHNLYIVVIFLLLVYSCNKDSNSDNRNKKLIFGSISDQEGNVYKTIKIGTQIWMAENLRSTKYNDGTNISNIKDISKWPTIETGAYCFYNNTLNKDSINTFGGLYNWYAVNTDKLAPIGWHVPSDSDWIILTNYLGGAEIAGGKMKDYFSNHWDNVTSSTTNESGFNALPSGSANISSFNSMGRLCIFWTSSEIDEDHAWERYLYFGYDYVGKNNANKHSGYSIRCLKDSK